MPKRKSGHQLPLLTLVPVEGSDSPLYALVINLEKAGENENIVLEVVGF